MMPPSPAPGAARGDRLRRLLRRAWERRVARYFLAALCGAAVDFSVFAALVYGPGMHYLWAATCSFVVSTLANYLVSVRVVFESGARFPRAVEIGVIYAVSATGLFWHQLILYGTIEHGGVHVMAAKVLATGMVFFWNYLMRRHFVFARVRRRLAAGGVQGSGHGERGAHAEPGQHHR